MRSSPRSWSRRSPAPRPIASGTGSSARTANRPRVPGGDLGLRLLPAPATLARLPYYAYHPLGLERRRAELIRAVAARATWFEAIVDLPLSEAYARLAGGARASGRGRPRRWPSGRWVTTTR